MEEEEEEEDAPKKIKKRAVVRKITVARADINGKGSVKADKGGRGKLAPHHHNGDTLMTKGL